MAVNCRVVLRDVNFRPGATEEEIKAAKKEAFDGMLSAFRDKIQTLKITNEYKRKQRFESPGEKKRRKRKENRKLRYKSERN